MIESLKAKPLYALLAVLGVFIVLLLVFMAGIGLGERKGRHFSQWCDSFDRMPGPSRRGGRPPMPFPMPQLPAAHGISGKIMSVSGTDVLIQGKDAIEQHVLVSSSTQIRMGNEAVSLGELHPTRDVAVFGSPNGEGQIEAKLIRLFGR